jgi:hypothetical protein
LPFPDGTGAAGGPTPFDTYSAGTVTDAGGGFPGPLAEGGPQHGAPVGPADAGMWPEGLTPPQANDGGLPAYLTDPGGFVPSPEMRDPDAPQSVRPSGPTVPGRDVESWLRAQVAATGGDLPQDAAPVAVGEGQPSAILPGLPGGPPAPETLAPVDAAQRAHSAILYGVGIPMALSAQKVADDGLFWKVACKTGTLALSPGPGQVDLDVPLELTPDLFDSLLEAYDEKAFPYVTVPETHGNGSLENTGYVKALEKLSKRQLMADSRIPQEGKDHVKDDPEDTEYLLSGIHFSKATAKQAAEEGSIPDTSVGVKMGYRNKRSGKTYKAALEHIALTPIPWVDGNIPFNPAVALSASSWDQKDSTDQTFEFDGVFTERPRSVDLGMEVRMSGSDFDVTATRAALLALQPGDSLAWNWEVNVERLAADSVPDGAFFLVRAPESDDPSDYGWERKPRLYTDIEGAMQAVVSGVAVCQQRRENERAKHAEAMAQPVPSYSAPAGADLNLGVTTFDPQKHPRDFKGQFKAKIGALKPGESVKLPDGQRVTRKTEKIGGKDQEGYLVAKSGFASLKGDAPSFWPLGDEERAANDALRTSESAGKKGELPDTLDAEPKAKDHPRLGRPLRTGEADPDASDADLAKALDGLMAAKDSLNINGASIRKRSTEPAGHFDINLQSGAVARAATAKEAVAIAKKGKKLTKPERKQQGFLSQDGPGQERDTLSLSAPSGSLEDVNDGAQGMPTETTPTVEEILAQQQADLERLQALVESQNAQLALSAQSAQTQGEVIHRNEVGKRIRALNGVYHPSILLAAQQVLVEDKPWTQPADGGFNLSVQAPSATKPGELEARDLKTPTDVVLFMLSAMPTLEGGGDAAATLAAINANLDDFNLSAHRAGTGGGDPEADARAAVDAWHREKHPELYGPDGKLIAA